VAPQKTFRGFVFSPSVNIHFLLSDEMTSLAEPRLVRRQDQRWADQETKKAP